MKTFCCMLICVTAFLGGIKAATAQQDGSHTDTVVYKSTYTNRSLPRFDVAAAAQLGYRSTGCDEYFPGIAGVGVILRGHFFRLGQRNSLYARIAGSAGLLPSSDYGIGLAFSDGWFAGISYALMQSPNCIGHHFATHKVEKAMSSILCSVGHGERGFYIEADIYIFLEKEEYIQLQYWLPDGVDPWVTTQHRSSAYAIRLGYIF